MEATVTTLFLEVLRQQVAVVVAVMLLDQMVVPAVAVALRITQVVQQRLGKVMRAAQVAHLHMVALAVVVLVVLA
jgi:hypothetical protein